MLDALAQPQLDALYRAANAFKADPRAEKLDLGVGVYRDDTGHSPIMACVREAEQRLAQSGDSKAYLPLAGFPGFIAGMSGLIETGDPDPTLARIQTVGGTGGVRLALELAQSANPGLTVHLGTPSWPNHQAICDRLKIPVQAYDYLAEDQNSASFANVMAALDNAARGDVLIMHGPCHNPTGLDLSHDEVTQVFAKAGERGVVPLIDAAYYGLGNDLPGDLERLAQLLSSVPECFLIMSGSKAFSLYRDRIGILFVRCADAEVAARTQANGEVLARVNYSAPAAHGAQVIAAILGDEKLTQDWKDELAAMRARLTELRAQIEGLADAEATLAPIWQTKGIFALLPLSDEAIDYLAKEHAIYLPDTGRINIAGLSSSTAPRFVEAVKAAVSR